LDKQRKATKRERRIEKKGKHPGPCRAGDRLLRQELSFTKGVQIPCYGGTSKKEAAAGKEEPLKPTFLTTTGIPSKKHEHSLLGGWKSSQV